MEKIGEQQICSGADRSVTVNGTKVCFGKRSPEDIAAEIKQYQGNVDKAYLEIGRLLLEAKGHFGQHGEWLGWLQANVDFSICKAQRLLKVAKWMDSKEAPELSLSFSQAYILSRLSEKDLKNFLGGKQVETMSRRQLQKAVSDFLGQKAKKDPSVTTTVHHGVTASAEDELRQRVKKLRNDLSQVVGLIRGNPNYEPFAAELRDFILQQFPSDDINDD